MHPSLKTVLALTMALLAGLQCVRAQNKTDYYGLYNYLFGDNFYIKQIRPVDETFVSLFVYMELSLLSLIDVNEKEQVLVSSVRLKSEWSDSILEWAPSDYGNITTIMVPQELIWLPDIILANGVRKQDLMGYDELPVRIDEFGNIMWEPTVILATSCDIDITYFPFDTQQCTIDFETAMSRVSEVDINIDKEDPITLDDYNEDGQWQLDDTSAENLINEGGKSNIRYTLTLSRRRTFYLIYIILPIFFLSLTSSLIFVLPPDEGEKTGTGITVVLAFAVYLTIVSDQVPNTSLQVSILGVYLISLLGLSAISLIACVYNIRVHFRDSTKEVGGITTRVVKVLRRLTFMKSIGEGSPGRNTVTPSELGDTETSVDARDKPTTPAHVEVEDLPPVRKMTWQDVAATYDWFCFLFFTGFTLTSTLVFMLALEIGSVVNKP